MVGAATITHIPTQPSRPDATAPKEKAATPIVASVPKSLHSADQKQIDSLTASSEQAGAAMEKLSFVELGLYGALSLISAFVRGGSPSPVMLANFAESLPEAMGNGLLKGNQAENTGIAKLLSPLYVIMGKIVSRVFNIRDKAGNHLSDWKSMTEQRGKVLGGVITSLNGLGLINSAYNMFKNFRDGLENNHKSKSRFLGGIESVTTALNAVSMLLCSNVKSTYLDKLNPLRGKKDTEIVDALRGGANEDVRCAAKSGMATLVGILEIFAPRLAKWVDAIGGTVLNVIGLKNGINTLRTGAEDEGEGSESGSAINLGKLPIIGPILKSLSKAYLNWNGVQLPA